MAVIELWRLLCGDAALVRAGGSRGSPGAPVLAHAPQKHARPRQNRPFTPGIVKFTVSQKSGLSGSGSPPKILVLTQFAYAFKGLVF